MLIHACHSRIAIMELTLKHPFSMLIAGGRKAGKTEFTKSILRSIRELVEPYPKRIVCCYARHQEDLYEELMIINADLEYVHVPVNIDTMFSKDKMNLAVLDDMMDEKQVKTKTYHNFSVEDVMIIYQLFTSHKIFFITTRGV